MKQFIYSSNLPELAWWSKDQLLNTREIASGIFIIRILFFFSGNRRVRSHLTLAGCSAFFDLFGDSATVSIIYREHRIWIFHRLLFDVGMNDRIL